MAPLSPTRSCGVAAKRRRRQRANPKLLPLLTQKLSRTLGRAEFMLISPSHVTDGSCRLSEKGRVRLVEAGKAPGKE